MELSNQPSCLFSLCGKFQTLKLFSELLIRRHIFLIFEVRSRKMAAGNQGKDQSRNAGRDGGHDPPASQLFHESVPQVGFLWITTAAVCGSTVPCLMDCSTIEHLLTDTPRKAALAAVSPSGLEPLTSVVFPKKWSLWARFRWALDLNITLSVYSFAVSPRRCYSASTLVNLTNSRPRR